MFHAHSYTHGITHAHTIGKSKHVLRKRKHVLLKPKHVFRKPKHRTNSNITTDARSTYYNKNESKSTNSATKLRHKHRECLASAFVNQPRSDTLTKCLSNQKRHPTRQETCWGLDMTILFLAFSTRLKHSRHITNQIPTPKY